MPWLTSLATDSYRALTEDRAAVVPTAFGWVACVADGMGGRRGGAEAAQAVLDAVQTLASTLRTAPTLPFWLTWCRQLDVAMSRQSSIGETTALVAALSDSVISGVVVGDSEAWHFLSDSGTCLNLGSHPKPWLGSGSAIPRPFQAVPCGTLLLATDGFTKYSRREEWPTLLQHEDLSTIPGNLIDSTRTPNGKLADDVAVIVARWV